MTIKNTDYPQNIFNSIFGHRPSNDYGPITKDMIVGLAVALSDLSEREEELLKLRYEQKLSYKAIGAAVDITPERARQIIDKAMRRLRHPHRACYIRDGIFGTIVKVKEDAFERGKNIGYKKGYEDALIERKGIELESYEAQVERDRNMSLLELNLSVRAYNCLARRGLYTVADAIALDSEEIRWIRNLGKFGAKEVATCLRDAGITGTAWDKFL